MMKQYVIPTMEVHNITVEDIMNTSVNISVENSGIGGSMDFENDREVKHFISREQA